MDLAKLVTENFKNGNEQEYSKRFTARPKTRRATIEPYKSILKYYDVKNQIAWDWASMDSAIVKLPKGSFTGKNPTDRAKLGG
ncbi:hypothetical protein ACE5IU_05945 [Leptospira kirschneri]